MLRASRIVGFYWDTCIMNFVMLLQMWFCGDRTIAELVSKLFAYNLAQSEGGETLLSVDSFISHI